MARLRIRSALVNPSELLLHVVTVCAVLLAVSVSVPALRVTFWDPTSAPVHTVLKVFGVVIGIAGVMVVAAQLRPERAAAEKPFDPFEGRAHTFTSLPPEAPASPSSGASNPGAAPVLPPVSAVARPSASAASLPAAPAVKRAPKPLEMGLPVTVLASYQLLRIDRYQFEKLIAAVYRARGYEVRRRAGSHADGGVDLLAERDNLVTLVQCKHWKNFLVPPGKVRELVQAKREEHANHAALITLCGFTGAARELACQEGVELVDEDQLGLWLDDLRETRAWPSISAALNPDEKRCPRCESPLLERIEESGPLAGAKVLGCAQHPRCRFAVES